MDTLYISEIFHSIQGEGLRAGRPCTFVRLQGCGLRCTWCDTPYALDFKKDGVAMAMKAILAQIESYRCTFVEFTGGEPLEHAGVFSLIAQLCDSGYEVAVETGGHIDISRVDARATIIMDVKCPGSGMMKHNRIENLEFLKPGDELKFVVKNREDYAWACEFIGVLSGALQGKEILFAPVFGELDNRTLAEWILADKLDVRMQIQMHKYIWAPDTRGV
jgi:7-carboxy-7-deazaguanine synthase